MPAMTKPEIERFLRKIVEAHDDALITASPSLKQSLEDWRKKELDQAIEKLIQGSKNDLLNFKELLFPYKFRHMSDIPDLYLSIEFGGLEAIAKATWSNYPAENAERFLERMKTFWNNYYVTTPTVVREYVEGLKIPNMEINVRVPDEKSPNIYVHVEVTCNDIATNIIKQFYPRECQPLELIENGCTFVIGQERDRCISLDQIRELFNKLACPMMLIQSEVKQESHLTCINNSMAQRLTQAIKSKEQNYPIIILQGDYVMLDVGQVTAIADALEHNGNIVNLGDFTSRLMYGDILKSVERDQNDRLNYYSEHELAGVREQAYRIEEYLQRNRMHLAALTNSLTQWMTDRASKDMPNLKKGEAAVQGKQLTPEVMKLVGMGTVFDQRKLGRLADAKASQAIVNDPFPNQHKKGSGGKIKKF